MPAQAGPWHTNPWTEELFDSVHRAYVSIPGTIPLQNNPVEFEPMTHFVGMLGLRKRTGRGNHADHARTAA